MILFLLGDTPCRPGSHGNSHTNWSRDLSRVSQVSPVLTMCVFIGVNSISIYFFALCQDWLRGCERSEGAPGSQEQQVQRPGYRINQDKIQIVMEMPFTCTNISYGEHIWQAQKFLLCFFQSKMQEKLVSYSGSNMFPIKWPLSSVALELGMP